MKRSSTSSTNACSKSSGGKRQTLCSRLRENPDPTAEAICTRALAAGDRRSNVSRKTHLEIDGHCLLAMDRLRNVIRAQ